MNYSRVLALIAIVLMFSTSVKIIADELDSDTDGIPDSTEGAADTDGDGIPNYLDLDSDGDGHLDAIEAGLNPVDPVDTDFDGIPNYLDLDSDNDLIPDSVEGQVNTDGDGNPNYVDWDSDNDTIPDRAEAGIDPANPIDSDADGTPDYLDLDSDNDDIPDSTEGLNDADLDGVFSYIDTDSDNDNVLDSDEGDSDEDGDGVPNYLDAPMSESNIDSDGDSVFDVNDRDDDNDGLMDFQENMLIDTDGDGVVDSKDLDSDNDAICDAHESGRFDVPGSCRFEVTNPDNFGIPDIVSTYPLRVLDTDDDGVPNLLDIDSDGDGLFDLTENGAIDLDGDGFIDRFLDENVDGKDDTAPSVLLDEDADMVPDYIDPSIDLVELEDSSETLLQPGTAQSLESDVPVEPVAFETSLDGYGGGCSASNKHDNSLLVVLVLLASFALFIKSRRRYMSAIALLLALQSCAISNNPGSFKQSLYFASGIGVSRLAPEPRLTELRVTDSSDRSSSLTIGADITRDFAIEFANHVLGESEISDSRAIEYDVAPTISVLRYMFRDPVKQRLRVGFAGYGRLGAGVIENESEVNLKRNNPSTILVGLGMEYIFYNGLGIRAEAQSFDSDAQSATVGLTYRFGVRPAKPKPVIKPTNRTYIPPKTVRPPNKL